MNTAVTHNQIISESLVKLQNYIEKEHYSGYDPYDALKSPLFKLPFFRKNKIVRFGAQQFIKRFPINLRPLIFVPKGLNPVSLGLAMQGYTAMGKNGILTENEVASKCEPLINQLVNLVPKGYSGACWGYDFDWEARYANIPAYQPTIVATGFITNALFQYFKYTGNKIAFNLCESACNFLSNDLNIFEDSDGTICFSYSPFDNDQVFNASMKGVRLLSQVYSINKDESHFTLAKKGAAFVSKYQQPDGSWKYAALNKGEWIDNYHTSYVLDCFDEFQKCCDDNTYADQIVHGFEFYLNNFFDEGCIPKFYNNNRFPVDCTSAAQSILTLIRFNKIELAKNVAVYMINTMQAAEGYFYFRKHKFYTEKQSFMRWSNAWMFSALGTLNIPK